MISKIYYDFFAIMDSTFEKYLLNTCKVWNKSNTTTETRIILIGELIFNLLSREINTDIFTLQNRNNLFEIEINYCIDTIIDTSINNTNYINYEINLKKWIEHNDYNSIASWILNLNNTNHHYKIYEISLNIFEIKKTKSTLLKLFNKLLNNQILPNKNIILLSKIMILFYKKHNIKRKKNTSFDNLEFADLVQYETILTSHELKHYNILKYGCICGINDLKYLCLFNLNRHKYNIKNEYYYNWLYYASFSPIWKNRIEKHTGIIYHETKKIIFKDDEHEELFYAFYGYEPDEQSLATQNKSIVEIINEYNWKTFYNTHKCKSFVEILEEELEELQLGQLQLNY
jgi:hypothetical protein